jgi:hypothetical protein
MKSASATRAVVTRSSLMSPILPDFIDTSGISDRQGACLGRERAAETRNRVVERFRIAGQSKA